MDPEERRAAIADAVVTVIARGGTDQATFANVAKEAGLVVGSVRHYFDSQAAMLGFAMRRLAEGIRGRVLRTAEPAFAASAAPDLRDRRAITVQILCETLPLDEPRRRETSAWLALSISALTRPELSPIVDEFHSGVRSLVREVLTRVREAGHLAGGDAEFDLDVEGLSALLDGLATDAALRPDHYSADLLEGVVRRHLERLDGR